MRMVGNRGLAAFAAVKVSLVVCRIADRRVHAANSCMGSWTTISEICGVFALAGLVKGGVGFGLPTVAIGLLGLVMTPAQAAALLVVPSLVTNTWQAVAG